MFKRHSCVLALALALGLLAPSTAGAFDRSFIGNFSAVTEVGSTVPSNGDENPYGIVEVSRSGGSLIAGNTLISNFNNEENFQGTGTTIVQISPTGHLTTFATINKNLAGCTGGVGLTTALAILPDNDVVVGSLPTNEGKGEEAKAGCLIFLSSTGKVLKVLTSELINGPWDLTAVQFGYETTLFVTNVLNGTVAAEGKTVEKGTVVRINLQIEPNGQPEIFSKQVIATGFPERTDPNALVIGPTGDGLGWNDVLYVADTLGNRIAAIPYALVRQTPQGGGGFTVAKGGFLNHPLGLVIGPNGDIITTNSEDGNIVETTPFGAEFQPFETEAGAGGLFGLAVALNQRGVFFVNDAENKLDLLH